MNEHEEYLRRRTDRPPEYTGLVPAALLAMGMILAVAAFALRACV